LCPRLPDWTTKVLLAAMTLVPTDPDRTALTPESLRDLLMGLRASEDRVEHIRVIERVGMLWIGAYVSVAEPGTARQSLLRLCGRLTAVIDGWELVGETDL
jgi:hypothetical protein